MWSETEQLPTVIWLTGVSGAGKSTIGAELRSELCRLGCTVARIDGDELRDGLCSDLGFSIEEREENVRRAGEVARLMVRNGLIAVVSLISPSAKGRAQVRGLFEPGEFFEVHVDTPLEVAEIRDPKGLYRRARAGRIGQFTGIDSPYEPPRSPEVRLDTVANSPSECALLVLDALVRAGRLPNSLVSAGPAEHPKQARGGRG